MQQHLQNMILMQTASINQGHQPQPMMGNQNLQSILAGRAQAQPFPHPPSPLNLPTQPSAPPAPPPTSSSGLLSCTSPLGLRPPSGLLPRTNPHSANSPLPQNHGALQSGPPGSGNSPFVLPPMPPHSQIQVQWFLLTQKKVICKSKQNSYSFL